MQKGKRGCCESINWRRAVKGTGEARKVKTRTLDEPKAKSAAPDSAPDVFLVQVLYSRRAPVSKNLCATRHPERIDLVMKYMVLRVGFLILLLSGGSQLTKASCGSRISPFVDGLEEERLQRIAELHAKGKNAISFLRSEIDNREIAPVELANLISSQERQFLLQSIVELWRLT